MSPDARNSLPFSHSDAHEGAATNGGKMNPATAGVRPARPATSTVGVVPGTSTIARAFSRSVAGKTLYDNRRIFTVWALATGLLTMAYASFYPQLSADSPTSVPEAMRGFGLDDNATAAGYLQGAVFGLLVPLLVTFYGAATGARMTSADEESGYLDLLLAHPIGRARLLLHRFAALAVGAVLLSGAVMLAVLTVRMSARLDSISVANFTAQTVNLALLGLFFGALGTAVGAATGKSRATVFGLTAGLGVLGYALNGFAPQIGAEWSRHLTPFQYYIGGEPLRYGFVPVDAAVLAVATAVLLGAGILRFARRDLGR
ncbi:ABC-2 type transport system permease protein [Micromonospora coriariae]|uniref:ABC-2 type transport system permease protein n=1 Tax=Micromonospora coriariae TaxID=285665 RepID=A0A1C4VN56_9ACTN|nr:ABC transporter permease subunit [Micromonospora coriariae]SCE85393.1 ABC-2 type transport system permease protein [Micromonospora coriariae]